MPVLLRVFFAEVILEAAPAHPVSEAGKARANVDALLVDPRQRTTEVSTCHSTYSFKFEI